MKPSKAIASLILSRWCPPSPDAAAGLLPRGVTHILLAWVLPCFRQEAQHTESATHIPHVLLPLQGPYISAVAAAPGRTGPPSSARKTSVWWEWRRSLQTGTLLKELEKPGRQAPQLECAARGPGREKAWGHCDPLSQTPWGALSSERPPSLQHTRQKGTEHWPGWEVWKLHSWGKWLRKYS